MRLLSLHADILRQPAVHINTQKSEAPAGVVASFQTCRTLSAADYRVHANPVANIQALHLFALLAHHPGKLVSLDQWEIDPSGELTAVNMDVTAADSGVTQS
jgi:hypothetical protein